CAGRRRAAKRTSALVHHALHPRIPADGQQPQAPLEVSGMSYTEQHLRESGEILTRFDTGAIEHTADLLADLRARGGLLFLLGVGGSAANCSHAVNDFRKICGIEAYAPTDNVSELTARTNDEGWASVFVGWLKVSRLCADDLVF